MPSMGWDSSYDFNGDDPLGMGEAMQAMAELGDLDQLESLLRGVTSPTALAEADMDKVRDLLGDDAMRSLQRLAELTKSLTEAGLIEQTEAGLQLTPRGVRNIGGNALRELFTNLTKDQIGQHQVPRLGFGHERTPDTKPYEYGDPFRLDLQRTIRNALLRRGQEIARRDGRADRACKPDDFEIEQTEHLTRSSTVLMLDLSMSMPMEGRFVPAKKVAMALHSLISSQFPRDYLGVVVFSETARVIKPEQIPQASWDYVYGTNMHHGLTLARQLLEPAERHEADHHGHRRRADGARDAQRRGVLPLPAGERDGRGDAARGAALHPRRHPHQHVHARRDPVAEGVRRADQPDQPRPSVLHDAREPRRLRPGRLHRAEAPDVVAPRAV